VAWKCFRVRRCGLPGALETHAKSLRVFTRDSAGSQSAIVLGNNPLGRKCANRAIAATVRTGEELCQVTFVVGLRSIPRVLNCPSMGPNMVRHALTIGPRDRTPIHRLEMSGRSRRWTHGRHMLRTRVLSVNCRERTVVGSGNSEPFPLSRQGPFQVQITCSPRGSIEVDKAPAFQDTIPG
jgi:hypothetical protein